MAVILLMLILFNTFAKDKNRKVMSNSFFKFKKFIVFQDRCAMKVGTDGTLLGAWANGGKKILDIGTGTGLVALMMAQRFDDAWITAVEIDDDACRQAVENVGKSIFADRIKIVNQPVQQFSPDETFDAVVCNPPFFVDSLPCPDKQRATARHAGALSFVDLFTCVSRLMAAEGEFSAIIPTESFVEFDGAARVNGFRCTRKCLVKTVPRKPAKRVLAAYSRKCGNQYESSEECIDDGTGKRSQWYSSLTDEFYLGK